MTNLLQVQDLSFSWPGRTVLDDLNFNVEPNQLVAVLGVNGAGKTTLLKCINRILSPSAGSINLRSKDVLEMTIMDVAKNVAYVPQSVGTNFPMNVFDVVLLGRRPHLQWFVGEEDRDKVSECLHFLDIDEFAFRRYDQLSGGERQRVVLAKALAQEPHLFLLDEPTSDLDLKHQITTMEKIRSVISDQSRPSSAIIAIHDIDIAAQFSDKIMLLHEGKIRAYGPPKEVLTTELIAEVFGVEAEIQAYSGLLRVVIHGALKTNEVKK